MNYGIKSKVFLGALAASVDPGQPVETVLEPGARIVGIGCFNKGVLTVDRALAGIYFFVGGVNYTSVNISANAAGIARWWWAGVGHSYKDGSVIEAAPAVDTINGFIPNGMPNKWMDQAGSEFQTQLQIVVPGLLSAVIVFYTLDPPNTNAYRHG